MNGDMNWQPRHWRNISERNSRSLLAKKNRHAPSRFHDLNQNRER